MTRRRHAAIATSTAALALSSLVLASTAAADNTTIAGSPVVTPGQTAVGNTSASPDVNDYTDAGSGYRSYWQLPVAAGDQVTIDWESSTDSTSLVVFPVGTSDYNVDSTSSFTTSSLGGND